MNDTWILGIKISDRMKDIGPVQSVLTKFGCTIRTRLGLHEISEGFCAPGGLILLELTGPSEEFYKLENELLKIDGIQVKKMVFTPA
ncbi:MAG TPA: hypothetical protein PKG48_12520 [Bacteroidales bacterium]|nr:hypothetical protein [Bacteroidales bacterium]HPS63711.1 hypothetical protein [Bacteroidales bacterium]